MNKIKLKTFGPYKTKAKQPKLKLELFSYHNFKNIFFWLLTQQKSNKCRFIPVSDLSYWENGEENQFKNFRTNKTNVKPKLKLGLFFIIILKISCFGFCLGKNQINVGIYQFQPGVIEKTVKKIKFKTMVYTK